MDFSHAGDHPFFFWERSLCCGQMFVIQGKEGDMQVPREVGSGGKKVATGKERWILNNNLLANQPTNKPANLPTNQPANQPTNKSTNLTTSQPANQPPPF